MLVSADVQRRFCGFLMAKAWILEELTGLFPLNPDAQQASVCVCVCVSACVFVYIQNACAVARVHNFLGVTAWMFCQMSASQP